MRRPIRRAGARGFLEAVGISEDEIATIAREWGANVIRIPFNQDFALNGSRGRSAEEYLGALDMVIAWAARHGCYTLLDLQWLDVTPRVRHDRRHGHRSRIACRRCPTHHR